jgi:hypothetical protein
VSEQTNSGSQGTSRPFRRTESQFRGFPEFRSNVLYCPKQFFTVVVPNSSVNCIRIVSYMLRKTLGWVDESGEPIQERHEFSYRDLEQAAGVSHSRLREAVADALKSNFIRRIHKARVQTQGVRAQSGSYELRWDEAQYSDQPEQFHGFYLQPTYLDRSGQTRLGRKNIPNVFFDYLVRNENRGVIRVVGTLLWYSIDWGKGGERKQPVKKSLRDLVELTRLDKSSVVRALDEAEKKRYVERIEKGVFDLSGEQRSSTTVYGIHWTNEYTYTYDGILVEVNVPSDRSQNATRGVLANAPKMQHGNSPRTIPKRDTRLEGERSQNATPHAPKTRHEERSQNATYVINNNTSTNTSIDNNSTDSPAPKPTSDAVAEKALTEAGFDKKTARSIASKSSVEVILQQVELLPKRRATKNRLGLLRRAIEENWAVPEMNPADISSLVGGTFAASFYAGYHGNPSSPVSDPSAADCEAAERFVNRLFEFWPDPSQVENWGRQFGGLVAQRHGARRRSFPALRPAIQQYGDDFYSRLRLDRETERRQVLERAQSAHYQKCESAYLDYLRAELARNEAENTKLFQALVSEEAEKLKLLTTSRFALDVKQVSEQYLAGRLARFQQILMLEEGHGVLDFWEWDKVVNPERFIEANV